MTSSLESSNNLHHYHMSRQNLDDADTCFRLPSKDLFKCYPVRETRFSKSSNRQSLWCERSTLSKHNSS
jgi:hypothetical protein